MGLWLEAARFFDGGLVLALAFFDFFKIAAMPFFIYDLTSASSFLVSTFLFLDFAVLVSIF